MVECIDTWNHEKYDEFEKMYRQIQQKQKSFSDKIKFKLKDEFIKFFSDFQKIFQEKIKNVTENLDFSNIKEIIQALRQL